MHDRITARDLLDDGCAGCSQKIRGNVSRENQQFVPQAANLEPPVELTGPQCARVVGTNDACCDMGDDALARRGRAHEHQELLRQIVTEEHGALPSIQQVQIIVRQRPLHQFIPLRALGIRIERYVERPAKVIVQ